MKEYKLALCVLPDHEKLPKKIEKLMKKMDYLKRLKDVEGGWQEDSENGDVILDASRSTQLALEKSIYDKLYPHQREGVAWMWNLFKKSSGGILGDDMGLGKTIQVSSFLHGLFHSRHIDTALLIMPLSLMPNWETELKKWCPRKRVRQFHGSVANRERALAEIREKSGIILTTYETAQSAFKTLSLDGETPITWDVIVLDEGHKIKDPTKKTSKAISTFQSKSKFILSGTPILNNLKELWALLNYTCDGQLLGDMKVFKKEFEEPIVRGQMKDASVYERQKGVAVTNKLREVIAPHFIRRMKSDIIGNKSVGSNHESQAHTQMVAGAAPTAASTRGHSLLSSPHEQASLTTQFGDDVDGESLGEELALSLGAVSIKSPSKSSAVKNSSKHGENGVNNTRNSEGLLGTPSRALPSPSRAINASSVTSNKGMALNVRKNDFVCWIPIERFQIDVYTQFLVSQRDRINEAIAKNGQALPAIRVLRQIANHPRLLLKPEKEEENALTFPGFDLPARMASTSVSSQSGKVRFLLDLLKHLKSGGHRVLIFSQSVKMLDLIENALDDFDSRWKRLRMDGSINKVAERKALVDEYNSNKEIFLFLMTTQVGGVGITLTSADRVVIFDPAWNTAIDDQAADRIYRIGQTRDVIIYRLISSGTIEEKMYRKQVFKGALSKSLLGKEATVHTYFTRTELRELFTFDPSDVKAAQTQLLLSSMHSHKRTTYPALDAELQFLGNLHTLAGVSDHNLLYTEEVSQLSTHSETDRLAADAHSNLSKTIVPKDVIQSEQAESSRKMAGRGKRGPITTIYVDDESDGAPRPRKDPSQVGTRVGDITLLSIDDQFELGLIGMKVTQEKTRRNPFSVQRSNERPRQGNLGGNDRVSALPIVRKASDTNMGVKKTEGTKPHSKPQNTSPSPSSTSTTSHVPRSSSTGVKLPTVSTKPTTSPSNTASGTTSKQPAPVVIKKAGSVVPTQQPISKPAISDYNEGENAEDEISRLLNDVALAHDAKRAATANTSSSRASHPASAAAIAPSASSDVVTPKTSELSSSSSGIKRVGRKLVEEDENDEFEHVPSPKSVHADGEITTSSVDRKSSGENSEDEGDEEEEDSEENSNRSPTPERLVARSPLKNPVIVEVDDDFSIVADKNLQSPVIRVPKMSRKSIVSFDPLPGENEAEAFDMGIESFDGESEKVETIYEDTNIEESNDEEGAEDEESDHNEGSECSEASMSELDLFAAEAQRARSKRAAEVPSKHFIQETGSSTDDEEAGAEDIGSEDESEEDFASCASADSHPSFIASEGEEEDAEDDIVEYDERELLIQRLLDEKKKENGDSAISPSSASQSRAVRGSHLDNPIVLDGDDDEEEDVIKHSDGTMGERKEFSQRKRLFTSIQRPSERSQR